MQYVNMRRVQERLDRLAGFTSFPGGITRQTYSLAWEESVLYVRNMMEALQMKTRIDGCGNLIGQYNPAASSGKPVGIGSHIDTVINGGAYDGALGVVAALELIEMAREQNILPARPVTVIAFAEEEGGVFGKGCVGSEYITGHTPLSALEGLQTLQKESLPAVANRAQLEKGAFGSDYSWGKDYFYSFYELHVEQGSVLEQCAKPVGIVKGVVGILRKQFKFIGQENHAGTTPMNQRKDALVALSRFVDDCYRFGNEHNGEIVVTNGRIAVTPNQHNVIPGVAQTYMEIRGINDQMIQSAADALAGQAKSIADEMGMRLEAGKDIFTPVQMFDRELLTAITGLNAKNAIELFSWAGHDAKIMGYAAPSVILFIPSRAGLSHCPQEYSDVKTLEDVMPILWECIVKRGL